MLSKIARVGWATVLVFALAAVPGLAQTPVGTAFTYQGRLTDAGALANGSYDLQFRLYDAASAGNPVGSQLTLTSVSVFNGLFTATLDFGASAFAGSQRWLEVGARPGGSGGAFTTLSPRQELTPTPNAAFSATTGDTSVQRRTVTPACPSGQYLRSLAADGTPTCAPDVDTNSGGTVTSVATGAGLTGGPISVSGTVSVATGGISSSMIANGAVGLAQINQAEVQARIGTCPPGQYLRGVAGDGSLVCEMLPGGMPVITTVDNPHVGLYTSIAIGDDGLPVISYQDTGVTGLKVAKCVNATCAGVSTITTVENPITWHEVGSHTSIAIGNDGLPVISYHDFNSFDEVDGALKVAKCVNAACTGVSTITTVDGPGPIADLGSYTSIAIGTDGLPVISYSSGARLKVAKCVNAACTGASTITMVDNPPANNVGNYTSIAIGTDNLPVISYQDSTAYALKVAHCGNAACTAGNTITTVDDPANSVGGYTSIAIGTDGLPVISYYDGTASALKVAHCGNAACSAGNTMTTVDDPANVVGYYTSIAIGIDNLPVISYWDGTAFALKVAHCGNAACTTGNTLATVNDPYAVGGYTSIAIGADGFPVISYLAGPTGALKVAKCGTRTCQ